MGVITKLLYRGRDLKKGRFQHLFLDMEENIHIHYRDLRIELSRQEFEEISATFNKQSQELLEIIYSSDYQDGRLANANQEDTRIWTESRLEHDVAYHPQRISIEECSDGYHLHLRNYKILLDEDDFRSLYSAFQQVDMEQAYAQQFDEILELLYANELHFVLPRSDSSSGIGLRDERREIVVANYHSPKINAIFSKIGLIQLEENRFKTQQGLQIEIKLLSYEEIIQRYPEGVGQPQIYLYEYLQNNNVNHELLNRIQCQVLNAFNGVRETALHLDLNYHNWRYQSFEKEVIFPQAEKVIVENTAIAYRNWVDFLQQHNLYFKKPKKQLFSKQQQVELYNQITDRLIEKVVPIPAVDKIYLMGSAARKELGNYQQPFVHGNWAKLGSDIDLLIEIDEAHKDNLPTEWRYINQSKTNRCDIYHIDEIKFSQKSRFESLYPHIDFYHHLFDTYLYFPSQGNKDLKDQFLEKFQAQLIFSKRPVKRENPIEQLIKQQYGNNIKNISRLDVASDNELYRFQENERLWVLKCFKVSGNYPSKRLREHIDYEVALLNQLKSRSLPFPEVMQNLQGKSVIQYKELPAVAFSYLEGKLCSYPDPNYPIQSAANILANFHNSQIQHAIDFTSRFNFESTFNMWHSQYYRYAEEVKEDKQLSELFQKIEMIYSSIQGKYDRISKTSELIRLHNHGDLTPRNFIFFESNGALFDFQNAFYGPRLFDLVDACFEFCFGGQYPQRDDFSRFEQFKSCYEKISPLTRVEQKYFPDMIKLLGLIKFIKEVRMIKGSRESDNLRRLRALGLGNYILQQSQS